MVTFESIKQLITDQVEFVDDQYEVLTEAVITSAGECQLRSLEVDQSKGDVDVSETISGLAEIAQTVGKSFGNLSEDDKVGLKSAVAKIVRFPDNAALESALEGLFGAYVDLLDAVKELNEYVATNTGGN